MIRQIDSSFSYTREYTDFISSLNDLKGHEWDKPAYKIPKRSIESVRRNKGMAKLKEYIKNCLVSSHTQVVSNISSVHCAYCGLRLEITSNIQIEHFSPKARNRTPEWMFLPDNLLLACQYCNGSKKKGNKATVVKKESDYNLCEFKIVHPRLHNPDVHYSFIGENRLVICKEKSSKEGKSSIKWFELDSHRMTTARINEYHENFYKVDLETGVINVEDSFKRKYFSD